MTTIRPPQTPLIPIGREPARREHIIEKLGDERAGAIPCPMLSMMVMEDLLVPDKDGNVTTDQLKKALDKVGISWLPRTGLAHFSVASVGDKEKGTLNLFDLFRSSIDHKGSLGPLQDGGFNQHLLDQLKSFSSDGVRLTIQDLAAAQLTRIKQEDGGVRDKAIGWAEISALTLVVGKGSPKALMLKDLDTIFKENRLPDDWKRPNVNSINLAWTVAKLAMSQNTSSAAARAEKGLREALDEPSRLDQTSMKGLAAMCPAGMRPSSKGVGIDEGEIHQLHANLAGDGQPGEAGASAS